MKNTRLISTALLAAVMLSLAACASDSGNNADETTADASVTAETTAAETERTSGLPEKDWGGRTFTIVDRGPGYSAWESTEIFAETETGEPLNDAIFARNMSVEEAYNVKIAERKTDKIAETVNNLIMAGDDSYDMIVCSGTDGTTLATNASLIDLYSIPHLNLDAEWWDQNAIRDFSIAGKLFVTCSDFIIADKDASWVLIFNKRIADDFGKEYPYQLIRDGQWTYETYYDMAKGVSVDLDGDGMLNPDFDQYGVATEQYDTYAAFFYSGARIFENIDGTPEFVLYNEKNITAYEAYLNIVNDTETYYNEKNLVATKMYVEGRGMLRGTTLLNIRTDYRHLEDDFGMLVVPKYDEAQDNYAHVVSIGGSGSVLCVPITTPDTDFTGFVLEALTFASTDTVYDTYVNTCFNGKYLRDDESIEMLDIALNSRVYELSIIYGKQLGGGEMGWTSYFMSYHPDTPLNISSY
nr:hypothetical protein [Clostridia bacterium]